jgi:hypothetical protein
MQLLRSCAQHHFRKIIRVFRGLAVLYVWVWRSSESLDKVNLADGRGEKEKREGVCVELEKKRRTLNTAWNASRNAPCPRRGRGNSDRHKRSGLQKMSSTGVAPSRGRGRPMTPRDCMTSMMTWISSAQLRGSWNTKIADTGVVEKSIACSPS